MERLFLFLLSFESHKSEKCGIDFFVHFIRLYREIQDGREGTVPEYKLRFVLVPQAVTQHDLTVSLSNRYTMLC